MIIKLPEHFTPIQRVCANYIEMLISMTTEMWFGSEWLKEIDFQIYTEMLKGKSEYIEEHLFENLKVCSEQINGWIAWDDDIHMPRYYTHEEIKIAIENILEKRKQLTGIKTSNIIEHNESQQNL